MRGKRFFRKAFGALFVSAVTMLSPVGASALTQEQLEMFAQNNILFYDPSGSECGSIVLGSFDGVGTAGLSDLQATFVDTYHDLAQNLSVEYGIPWETVMAQGILESAAGMSDFARYRNNFFGIGAFDSNPDNAFSYDTPEDGWRGYYENIKNTATYRNNGVFAGEAITNPYVYAQVIKNAGYATDPNYVSKLNDLIGAVENRAREKGWLSSADLARTYPEMLANASINAASSDGSTTVVVTAGCLASGNGDINLTALELSWPDRTHPLNDPKPEYVEAMKAVGLYQKPCGVDKEGNSVCPPAGASCDQFVTTVMKYSGADPDFGANDYWGAADLLKYLSSHLDLYEEIPNTGSTDNLQPGDIRSDSGHIEIVVQTEDGTFKIASASWNDRTGDHGKNFYPKSSFRIFRRK